VLLSETEYRHQVEIDIAPFKGLLIGLFFITVGMSIDVRMVWGAIGTILLVVVLVLVVKASILYAACRLFGVARSVTVEAAILLAQAGEFAFIVIALGRSTGLVPGELAQGATAVVGISMVLTPFLAIGARALAGRIQRIEHRDRMPTDEQAAATDHVIIGGYGRVGQVIARLLRAENVPFVALDTHAELVGEGAKRGEPVFLGDAARAEFLRRAGAPGARAFVVTVNSARAAERMVVAARKERPDVPVFARARDPAHASRLLRLGAVEVTLEAVEASLQLGARVLEGLGVSDDAIARRLDDMRDAELARISAGGETPARGD
jgi:CPA2 family monovalent cation:H+ antiporter-2